MSESKQRKNGIILSYLSIIISTVIQLLYTPMLIRFLGQSEYGLYSLVSSIIGYLTVLDFGFGNAIVVYTAKYKQLGEKEKIKKLHGMFKIIFNIIGIVAVILGIILYFNVETIFANSMTLYEVNKAKVMIIILTFNLAITFPFSIYSAIITAHEKFTYLKLTSIINSIIKPVIMIPLLFLGLKSITMCIVITLVNVSILVANYLYCQNKLNVKIKYCGFDKIIFKTIFGYSIWIFLNVIVDKVNWSVDQFILGAVSGTLAVSVYSVASQINTLFVNLSSAISNVMLPKMSKMVAEDTSMDKMTEELTKIGRLQCYIIFLLASGFVLLGKEFVIFWAGSEYDTSYYVALLLIIPACIPLIQSLALSICQALNKHKFRAYVTTATAVVNVIISYFLTKQYGPIGSALGTSIAVIICNVIVLNLYYHFKIKLNMVFFWKNILSLIVPFILPIITVVILKEYMYISGIIGVIAYGCIYSIMYVIIAYFVCMNGYEKNMINKLIKGKKVI